jgi:drug/metabolite transporter (DMT)-like permease
LFGSATPVSKLVGETFPPMMASGLRMLTAVTFLAPILAIRRVSPGVAVAATRLVAARRHRRDRRLRLHAAWILTGLAVAVAGIIAVNIGGPSSGSGSNLWLGSLIVFGAVCCEATYTWSARN